MTVLNVTGDLDTAGSCYGIDGPDVCHDDCGLAVDHTEDECGDLPCPTCRGAGGWQQHDGLIVECPRGCMTEDGPDPDTCANCDHQRAFHHPAGDGICLGHCDCCEFEETA